MSQLGPKIGYPREPIYFDYNATSPVHPDVASRVAEWLPSWGNASSIHAHGRKSKQLVREARRAWAQLIGAHPMELVFTSGGSESNNIALKSALSLKTEQRNEIISSPLEHPSVLRTLEWLETQGLKVHWLKVSAQGEMDLTHYQELLSEKTLMVSIMAANNEMGVINPVAQMSEMSQAAGAYFHCDAVQTPGRMSFRVDEHPHVDLVSFSGHKFYALKGVGVLFSRRKTPLSSLIHGGAQERGRRAGTENTLAIASLGHMAQLISESAPQQKAMTELRSHLEERLLSEITGVRVLAQKVQRLPNTCCALIDGVHGESLLMSLDMKGFSVSTGAACSSGSPEPSHVLRAIGLSHEEAQTSLRLSLGWFTTLEQVDLLVDTLKGVVDHLRSLQEESNEATKEDGEGQKMRQE